VLTLGYDIGSSSVKCALFDCDTGRALAHGSYPAEEMPIHSPKPGWAEQDPEEWWKAVVALTHQMVGERGTDSSAIRAIGISYQMHGLVLVDRRQRVLRPSIIWCDSRAVEIGRRAFAELGTDFCLSHLLNSPGNFTAAKLRWVKEYEGEVFARVHKAMLPGEFIAMKLTGEISTTVPGLSEGIYWDFTRNAVSSELLAALEIDGELLPEIRPTFSDQGEVTGPAAEELGLRPGTLVAYRAGDQPNNAFSLNVLRPGEVAATAGTSGVVYGVSGRVTFDVKSRVNPFAHVNHSPAAPRLGILLCINGTGILNSWLRRSMGSGMTYEDINRLAAKAPIGADGLSVVPFGNGAERILENRNIGCRFCGIDLNRHTNSHLFRAAQEGIAFAFRYGMDIMREMGLEIQVIRAGHANMFLSPLFRQTLANIAGVTIELYETSGAQGAARGAAVGGRLFASVEDAFDGLSKREEVRPSEAALDATEDAYRRWESEIPMN
jgi:xylulokinase